MKFYAIATTNVTEMVNGEKVYGTRNFVLGLESEAYVSAVNEAKERCKECKIAFQFVRPASGQEVYGSTMTKDFKRRKALRGGTRKKK